MRDSVPQIMTTLKLIDLNDIQHNNGTKIIPKKIVSKNAKIHIRRKTIDHERSKSVEPGSCPHGGISKGDDIQDSIAFLNNDKSQLFQKSQIGFSPYLNQTKNQGSLKEFKKLNSRKDNNSYDSETSIQFLNSTGYNTGPDGRVPKGKLKNAIVIGRSYSVGKLNRDTKSQNELKSSTTKIVSLKKTKKNPSFILFNSLQYKSLTMGKIPTEVSKSESTILLREMFKNNMNLIAKKNSSVINKQKDNLCIGNNSTQRKKTKTEEKPETKEDQKLALSKNIC